MVLTNGRHGLLWLACRFVLRLPPLLWLIDNVLLHATQERHYYPRLSISRSFYYEPGWPCARFCRH